MPRDGANLTAEASMTTNEKNYLNRGKGDARVPTGAENEAWIPTPFADEDINPDYAPGEPS